MRRLIASALFLLASLTPAFAQGFIPAGSPPWVYADNYGRWAVPGQAASTYTFSPGSICNVTQLDFQNRPVFQAFNSSVALAPVFISDVNSANSEVITPGSAFTPTQATCGANLAPVNAHTTFTLQSGTGGLQEAINAGVGRTIVLDSSWYGLINGIATSNATLLSSVNPAAVIGAAVCSTSVQLLDVTTNPWTQFSCSPATSRFVLTALATKAPTIAAGAGAGTGPTVAVIAGSSASSGTVTVTTGTTPTASAAIFTLTFPSTTAGGFPYAPSCTYTSIGATAYAGAVASATAGPPATSVLTATSTALTASTSTYKWTYTCH